MLKRKIKKLFGLLSGRYKKCYSRMWQEGLTSMGRCYMVIDRDTMTEYWNSDCAGCPYLALIEADLSHDTIIRLDREQKGENHNGD